MPYPNEHSCRLRPPDRYDRFRRENNWRKHDGKRIDAIWGVTDEGDVELQAMRYPKAEWDADDARAHCAEASGSFEPAASGKALTGDAGGAPLVPQETGAESTYMCECLDCGYTLKSTDHCRDIKCPSCGGEMRRAERPGPGQKAAGGKQSEQWKAIPASRHEGCPLAPEDAEWDAGAAVKEATVEQLRDNMALFVRGEGDTKDDYSFAHHRPDGTLVWAALKAAMSRLNQGFPKGASDTVRRAGYNHLAAEYKRFDKEPPEFKTAVDLLAKRAVKAMASAAPDIQAKGEGDTGGFYGYLAVYGNVDYGGDMFMPGAFAKSLKEHDTWPLMVKHAAYGGDVTEVVGSFTAREDEHGLFIDATYLDTPLAQETRAKTDAGIARGLSVGYREIRAEDIELEGRMVRAIHEAALIEGTITLVPMNELAMITGTKKEVVDRATELVRLACAVVPGRTQAADDVEGAKRLLAQLEESAEGLRGLLASCPSGEGQDRVIADGLVELRRKRLRLAKARADMLK